MRTASRGTLLAAAFLVTAGTVIHRGTAQQAKDQSPTVTVYKSPT
jgi:hypothetical protein